MFENQVKLFYKLLHRFGDLMGIVFVLLAAVIGTGVLTEKGVEDQLYNEVHVKKGEQIFNRTCISCHGPRGEQLVNQKKLSETSFGVIGVEDAVRKGRPGMPPYEEELTREERRAVAAYVEEEIKEN